MFFIRDEEPDDLIAIERVNRAAFDGDLEARLVDRLRSDGLVIASLVAVQEDQIVGHILFSDLPIDSENGAVRAVSLAPMAVSPKFQRQGIGSALVWKGLERCRERGRTMVIVVGHPEYYPRFGFSSELAKRLQSPYSGDCWMALELVPGAHNDLCGTVRYPEAFDIFS
jgi:putative acetyltransferase